MSYTVKVDHDSVIITLATGEVVRIIPRDDGLDEFGHGITILAERPLIVMPRTNNGVDISTLRAMIRLDERHKAIVAARPKRERA